MSFGDKVIDLFMPTKKESRQNSEPTVNKQKPEVEDFTKLIDRDSLHSLFPFSWEQYPTYAIQDYQIYIIDPENEYTKIVEALGGVLFPAKRE